MKKRISKAEVSAYLDGEAKNPAVVRQQIEDSHEAARHYAELSKLSERLKALPEPELRPGFAGRVVASLNDPLPAPANRWRVPSAMAAAAAAILLGVAALIGVNDSAPSTETLQTASVALSEEAAILADLERHIATSPESDALLSGGFFAEPEPVVELPEDLLVALAPSDWLETFTASIATHDHRIEATTLNDAERDIFVQLLEEHAVEALQGQAAHEG